MLDLSSSEPAGSGQKASNETRTRLAARCVATVRRNPLQTAALVAVVVLILTLVARGNAPTAEAVAPTADLVGYWSLNEASGPVASDSSAGGHNGTLVSGPAWVTGKAGSGLAFSGTSYVAIGDVAQVKALSAVTLSGWMRRSTINAKVLIGKQTAGHDLAIEAWNDGRIYFDLSNGTYADGYIPLNDTAWHHYTLVFSGQGAGNAGRLKAYVDGAERVLTYEGTIPASTTSSSTPFNISKLQDDYSSGSVDEVRLYSRALTPDEVRSLVDLPPAQAPPTVTSVSPASGPSAGGTTVTITGTGFAAAAGATTARFGTAAATGVSCASTTTCNATSPAGTGTVDVTVTVGGVISAASASDRFAYVSPPPTATSVSPASGSTAGGTAVTIGGTGFRAGASVTFDGVTATGVSVTGATSMRATTPPHADGAVNVVVANTDGQAGTCSGCFTYATEAPAVTSVAPASGPAVGGTTLTVTGTGFATQPGATTVAFGAAPASGVSCASTTSCSATSPAGSGTVDVTVTAAGVTSAVSAADRYTYVGPAPTVGSVTPSSGSAGGGTTVTIDGTGFATGASVSFDGVAATGVSVRSAGSIAAMAPPHAVGTANVTVTNADGQSGSCPACFTYIASASVFPLTVSTNGRYLLDASGAPFRLQGEAAWSMIANLTYSEADMYLSDRKAKGFNAVLVNLLERRFAVNAPANRRGDLPFSTSGDFRTPNEAYFSYADSLIDLAASKGMTVLLAYMYLGNIPGEGWRSDVTNGTNTQAVCYDFGRYLGNRYRDRANIIWVTGGDFWPDAGSELETRVHKIMDGIKSVPGASRLHTAHWASNSLSTDKPAFAGAMNLNAAYKYDIPYDETGSGYAFNPPIPTFLLESGYEAEGWSPGDPASIRGYEYGSYLTGIGGVFYGHRDVWEFATDTWSSGYPFGSQRWQLSLNAPGALDMMRMDQLLDSVPWWNLVPSGQNGMKRLVTAGGGFYGSTAYVTAAATPDGSTLLAYVPSTGSGARTITVDMTALSGSARGRWYNPTTGAYTNIASSIPNIGTRQFTTPGNNGTGANDWVLVLDRG